MERIERYTSRRDTPVMNESSPNSLFQDQLESWARELFGDNAKESPLGGPNIRRGSSNLWVKGTAFSSGKRVFFGSMVVRSPRITHDLALLLLKKNTELECGSLGIDDDDNIVMHHRVFGEVLRDSFRYIVNSLLSAIDDVDDEIVLLSGGLRHVDSVHSFDGEDV